MFKQLFTIFLALLVLLSISRCNGEKKVINVGEHKIIVDKVPTDPFVDMIFDDIHVKGTYYDQSVVSTDYTESRKEFDQRLITALTEFGYNFANDIVVKNSYIVVIGPKYTAKLTSLISTYLPEFNRQDKSSGLRYKDGFIGDALTIWKSITKDILIDNEKRAQLVIPANPKEFMQKLRQFMDMMQQTVANSPVGIYIDWRTLTIDDKTIAEFTAPFIAYLQENGYKKHIGIMDTLMGIVAKIKPGTDSIKA